MPEGPRLDAAGREYARAIEKYFRRYLDRPINLSPKDIEAVKRWWTDGIPLEAVVMGIDAFFFRNRDDRKKLARVRSLRYCEDDVRTAWEIVAASRIGDHRGEALEEPSRLAEALEALGKALARGARRLEEEGHGLPAAVAMEALESIRVLQAGVEGKGEAGGAPEPSAIERALQDMDRRLLDAVRDTMGQREVAAVRRQSERTLEASKERMTEAAYNRTVALLEDKLLRERFKVPRLSLYSY